MNPNFPLAVHAVCAALQAGVTLSAVSNGKSSTVGPVECAGHLLGFRCLTNGASAEQTVEIDEGREEDLSAYAAAVAFVKAHGVEASLAAVAAVQQKKVA